jgi:hypothetical protein
MKANEHVAGEVQAITAGGRPAPWKTGKTGNHNEETKASAGTRRKTHTNTSNISSISNIITGKLFKQVVAGGVQNLLNKLFR